jgi:hypothetical protein
MVGFPTITPGLTVTLENKSSFFIFNFVVIVSSSNICIISS